MVKKIEGKEIISIGLLGVLITTYFLPFMHERYMFMADILSVIWYFLYRRKIYIPIIINLSSLAGYSVYLFGLDAFMDIFMFNVNCYYQFIIRCIRQKNSSSF